MASLDGSSPSAPDVGGMARICSVEGRSPPRLPTSARWPSWRESWGRQLKKPQPGRQAYQRDRLHRVRIPDPGEEPAWSAQRDLVCRIAVQFPTAKRGINRPGKHLTGRASYTLILPARRLVPDLRTLCQSALSRLPGTIGGQSAAYGYLRSGAPGFPAGVPAVYVPLTGSVSAVEPTKREAW